MAEPGMLSCTGTGRAGGGMLPSISRWRLRAPSGPGENLADVVGRAALGLAGLLMVFTGFRFPTAWPLWLRVLDVVLTVLLVVGAGHGFLALRRHRKGTTSASA